MKKVFFLNNKCLLFQSNLISLLGFDITRRPHVPTSKHSREVQSVTISVPWLLSLLRSVTHSSALLACVVFFGKDKEEGNKDDAMQCLEYLCQELRRLHILIQGRVGPVQPLKRVSSWYQFQQRTTFTLLCGNITQFYPGIGQGDKGIVAFP